MVYAPNMKSKNSPLDRELLPSFVAAVPPDSVSSPRRIELKVPEDREMHTGDHFGTVVAFQSAYPGGIVMSTTRKSVPIIVRGCGLAIAFMGCATNHASGMDGTIPSTAQYVAVADDACPGMPAKERALGLRAYRENIVRVTPLFDDGPFGKIDYSDRGAVIRLRATLGMSIPWLERVNSCHVALAALGRVVDKESTEDPFLVPRATVWVVEGYGGYYDLSVRSENDALAAEILRRSKGLLPAPAQQATAALGSP